MNAVGSALATDLQITENIMLNAPIAFHESLSTEASLTYQTSMTEYGVATSSRDHYLTAINRWTWYAAKKITARAGADWRFLYINTESATETDPHKFGNQGGVYVTAEWKPLKSLFLVANVKLSTDTKEAVPVPKIGLRWQVHNNFALKNNYFRSFKFPDFDDLYYRSLDSVFVGNPNLKPEDGWGADLIGELLLGELFSLDSSLYGQYTTDSIHWVKSAGGRWSPENVGTAWFFGFDIRPKLTLKINKAGINTLSIGASYQLQYSWLLNGNLNFYNSFRIPYMPTHIAGGSLDIAWKGGSFFIQAHYESTRYADTLNEMPLASYCIVHATLNQDIGKHFTTFLSLRNITNAHYESFASYHMPGISFTAGVRSRMSIISKSE